MDRDELVDEVDQAKKKDLRERLDRARSESVEDIYLIFDTSEHGLKDGDIKSKEILYGSNQIDVGEEESLFDRIREAFINPFTAILIALAVVSFFTDVILAPRGEKNPLTVIIIVTMVLISGILKFVQELKSDNAAKKLSEMVQNTTLVERIGMGKKEIPMEDVVVGDVIHLSAGDMIPADMRIVEKKDLFIAQSALTGESEPVEKSHRPEEDLEKNITESENMVFMGSTVISGSAKAVVVATGKDTVFGSISKTVAGKTTKTSFEKGVDSVSWLLIRFMLIMVPIVFFVNGFTKKDWIHALLFSISIAVGLTPEMLPMIVTTTLAKGAVAMSKEKTIVKNLNSIQNLGSMDVLCTDKTGTLTQDNVVLEYHLDIEGRENQRVLKHAFLNSYFQTGLKNLMDLSIIKRTREEAEDYPELLGLENIYKKVDEVPFDFSRRRMSVVVKDSSGKTQMITKGAIEEMISISEFVDYGGQIRDLTEEMEEKILRTVDDLNEKGMRVIGVAQKTNPPPVDQFSIADEKDMVLIGYLAFLDPPKDSAEAAIKTLRDYGVTTKVLTGDNELVTKSICEMINFPVERVILGQEVEDMDDKELSHIVENYNVFAKLSPLQKSRIVTMLRSNGHTVGYMGDGINDAPAMKASDTGISVDTGVDIAKESAEVILLEKDLEVLEKAIVEGRKTYGNMIKYIKMTASSNFGNVFSVLIASAFLPFLPMEPIHLILLNLIYDISCIAIPWDNVDEDYLKVPRKWDAGSIKEFMLIIGPTSSVFDIVTYLLMFFVVAPNMLGASYGQISDPALKAQFISIFQSGWFIESMWTQTLVIYMLRTSKKPFIESHASSELAGLTTIGILIATIIPFTGLGRTMGLTSLPLSYFGWLFLILAGYIVLASLAKKIYLRRHEDLL